MKISALVIACFAFCGARDARANVHVEGADCSGVVFKMEGMSAASAALILTNGHCISHGRFRGRYPDAGESFYDLAIGGRVRLQTKDGRWRRADYDRIVFATMTGADLAILRLDATYRDVENDGVEVFEVSREPVSPGQRLDVASAHLDRRYQCRVEAIAPIVREGPWTWTDVPRLAHSRDRCTFGPGVSGSQAIDPQTGRIVALANTMYEKGEACAFNNPCEVDENGKVTVAENYGQSYVIQTWRLYSCYDLFMKDFRFELAECQFRRR